MSEKLYDLIGAYKQFETRLYEAEGEITEETQDIFEGMQITKDDIQEKVENIAKVVLNLEGDAEKFDSEMKRLQARKQALSNNARRVKEWLKDAMLYLGTLKIKGEVLSVAVQNSPPSIRDEDIEIDRLAEPFKKVIVTPNKKALLDEWRETGNVPTGVKEITQNQHLRIR